MRYLFFCLIWLGFNSFAQGNEFAEAQVRIAKDQNGQRMISVEYKGQQKFLHVQYRVEWLNYSKEEHGTGFHLSRAYRAFINSPDPSSCRIADFAGILYPPKEKPLSHIYFLFEGLGCEEAMEEFLTTLDPSYSFYGTPFLKPMNKTLNALGILFFP